MADVVGKEKRSEMMAGIKGRNTRPEVTVRKALWSQGFRYRINTPLPGKPDIVFARQRVVIFIDGCFWHRCPSHYHAPASNEAFWRNKIERNVVRDDEVNKVLQAGGWQVVRVWEHDVRNSADAVVKRLLRLIG